MLRELRARIISAIREETERARSDSILVLTLLLTRAARSSRRARAADRFGRCFLIAPEKKRASRGKRFANLACASSRNW